MCWTKDHRLWQETSNEWQWIRQRPIFMREHISREVLQREWGWLRPALEKREKETGKRSPLIQLWSFLVADKDLYADLDRVWGERVANQDKHGLGLEEILGPTLVVFFWEVVRGADHFVKLERNLLRGWATHAFWTDEKLVDELITVAEYIRKKYVPLAYVLPMERGKRSPHWSRNYSLIRLVAAEWKERRNRHGFREEHPDSEIEEVLTKANDFGPRMQELRDQMLGDGLSKHGPLGARLDNLWGQLPEFMWNDRDFDDAAREAVMRLFWRAVRQAGPYSKQKRDAKNGWAGRLLNWKSLRKELRKAAFALKVQDQMASDLQPAGANQDPKLYDPMKAPTGSRTDEKETDDKEIDALESAPSDPDHPEKINWDFNPDDLARIKDAIEKKFPPTDHQKLFDDYLETGEREKPGRIAKRLGTTAKELECVIRVACQALEIPPPSKLIDPALLAKIKVAIEAEPALLAGIKAAIEKEFPPANCWELFEDYFKRRENEKLHEIARRHGTHTKRLKQVLTTALMALGGDIELHPNLAAPSRIPIPADRQDKIVVASVGDAIYIRIYNRNGFCVKDVDSRQLNGKDERFQTLRKRLDNYDPLELSDEEKARLIQLVREIVEEGLKVPDKKLVLEPPPASESYPRPTNQAFVFRVQGELHFCIFDSVGDRIRDAHETELTKHAGRIDVLRRYLSRRWPPHQLTSEETRTILNSLAAIFGSAALKGDRK